MPKRLEQDPVRRYQLPQQGASLLPRRAPCRDYLRARHAVPHYGPSCRRASHSLPPDPRPSHCWGPSRPPPRFPSFARRATYSQKSTRKSSAPRQLFGVSLVRSLVISQPFADSPLSSRRASLTETSTGSQQRPSWLRRARFVEFAGRQLRVVGRRTTKSIAEGRGNSAHRKEPGGEEEGWRAPKLEQRRQYIPRSIYVLCFTQSSVDLQMGVEGKSGSPRRYFGEGGDQSEVAERLCTRIQAPSASLVTRTASLTRQPALEWSFTRPPSSSLAR